MDRMTHFCVWKPFEQTKVNTFLQLFEKFNMDSYWVGEGFLTNEMMLVVYDDHDHASRLTQEQEI